MFLLNELRIEDILTACLVAVILALGVHAQRAPEDRWWEYSFVIFPAMLLVLGASIRYAFGQDSSAGERSKILPTIGRIIRDWLPFALFLAFYETLRSQLVDLFLPREMDGTLLGIDRALLGETPAVTLQRWISPGLTEVMTFCYFSHLILPPILAVLWYRRDVQVFRAFLLSFFLCGALGGAGYLSVPAVGPKDAFPQLFRQNLDAGGRGMEQLSLIVNAGRAPHDVFPSLHVALSALVLVFAWKYGRTLFFLFLPLVLGNWVSTLYLRYHYFIDIVVAFPCTLLAIVLARWLLKAENLWRRGSHTATGHLKG